MKIFGFRPALWPTVFTIPALVVLLGLGSWQVHRLFWKLDLIQTIESGLAAPAAPLPAGDVDPDRWNYRHVTVSGRFDHSREFHLLAHSKRGNFGYQIVTPFRRSDAPGWVLVDRGWVPPDFKEQDSRRAGLVEGEVTIRGIAHRTWGQGPFVPDNDVARNLWFFPDVQAMARLAGIGPVPTLLVDADETPVPGGWPRGGQTRVDFPNNHLSYAVTWYGGAVVLCVIYVLWHRRREREEAAGPERQDR
ncbi:SURF1 family protein [Ferrovibrio sp.]|uniref:SURF1 family protein n=1 Tax=Ferrovibrio sp. TaxID=1917215 RepID=UPI00311E8AF9